MQITIQYFPLREGNPVMLYTECSNFAVLPNFAVGTEYFTNNCFVR